jgi:HPt (histidine-containing phosphotransfer) domain-containing protein
MDPNFEDSVTVRAALAEFQDLGGREFVAEMIQLLKEQTPKQLSEIECAFDNGDLATAQRHAHSMKSTFGNFGAKGCQNLAIEMDRAGKANEAAAYQAAFEQLKIKYESLNKFLAQQ